MKSLCLQRIGCTRKETELYHSTKYTACLISHVYRRDRDCSLTADWKWNTSKRYNNMLSKLTNHILVQRDVDITRAYSSACVWTSASWEQDWIRTHYNYAVQKSFERHFEMMKHSQLVLLIDVYFSRPPNRVVGIQKVSIKLGSFTRTNGTHFCSAATVQHCFVKFAQLNANFNENCQDSILQAHMTQNTSNQNYSQIIFASYEVH